MFDIAGGMFKAVLFDPAQDRVIVFQAMHRLLESVAVELEKAEEMFVEADRLVVVTIEQSFAMKLCLVDQAREVDVAAELFVRTARMQSSHGRTITLRATAGPRPTAPLTQISSRLLLFRATTR